MRYLSLCLAVLILCSFQAWSQDYLPVEHLSPKDGFSFRWVHAVYQDSTGFIWIGTHKGLNRYDGLSWDNLPHLGGDSILIQKESVHWIFEVEDEDLLIGTHKEIYLFDPVTFSIKKSNLVFNSSNNNALTPEPVRTANGDVLLTAKVADREALLLFRYKGNANFEEVADMGQVYSRAYVPNFDKWLPVFLNKEVGIHHGLQLSDYVRIISSYYREASREKYHQPFHVQDRFEFPSIDSLQELSLQSFQLPPTIPKENWEDYFFDNHQNIWLEEKSGRIFKYDLQKRLLQEVGRFDFDIIQSKYSIFEDKEETLWIAHQFGISKVKRRRNYFENYLNVESFHPGNLNKRLEVYDIVEDSLGRVLAAEDVAFYLIDPKTQETEKINWYDATPNGYDYRISFAFHSYEVDMEFSPGSLLWLKYGKGGTYYNLVTSRLYTGVFPPGDGLEKDHNGQLWTICKGHFCSIDPISKKIDLDSTRKHPPLQNRLVFGNPNLWANTEKGVVKLNLENDSLKYYELFPKEGKKTPETISMFPFKGFLWLGTVEGLIKFDPEKQQIKIYTQADGLPHNIVYTILGEGEYLWMGTHQGLCKFNIYTEEVKNYYVEDGLTHNEFNRKSALKASDGKMYFGGLNGVNAFFPTVLDSIEKSEASQLVWRKFSMLEGKTDSFKVYSGSQLDAWEQIKLSFRDKTLSFNFALLSLVEPHENEYYYFLEGFDDKWHPTGRIPNITFHSLLPGNYTLKVKAIDFRRNESMNELVMPIIIYGPWWRTWWAYTLLVVLIVLSFLGFRHFELKRKFSALETRRLQELDEAKTKLYTNITHEFRTPLTVITGMTTNIEGHEKEKKLILRNGKKLLSLINQLLDLSKFDSGLMSLDLSQSDMIAYLSYLIESFYALADNKGIKLVFYTEVPQLLMDFDEVKMQQIIYNLLSNALKFSTEGGKVILHVNKSPAGDQLQLKVQDKGIGISPEKLPHIFNRFYQVDGSTTRKGEGTGIGLALTQEYVELMGGEISVSSVEGEGTEFSIRIPIKNKAPLVSAEDLRSESEYSSLVLAQSTSAAEKKTLSGFAPYLTNDKPSLLIIEDNEDVTSYIQSIVDDQYQVETALNGKIGLERAIELIPDIIISDVMMPEMDGFSLTQALKNDERTSHIPIILLTAKAAEKDRMTGLQTGADAYLTKPFNKTELLIRLEKLTELRKALQAHYASDRVLSSITGPSTNLEDAFLKKIHLLVETHLYDSNFGIEELCKELELSRMQVHRKLKALTNQSTSHFIRSIRLYKAKELLLTTKLTVSEIAYDTGFSDPNHFSRVFKENFGMSPTQARK